jgi:hypothetical protein
VGWRSVVLWWAVLCIMSVSPLRVVAAPPTDPQQQATTDVEQDRQRFVRLQRKGVIGVHRSGTREPLRLTIDPLVWDRLTPQEQQNFMQRAQRLFGGTVVEMHSLPTDDLLARFTANGGFESFTTPLAERIQRDRPTSESSPTFPAVSKGTGQGR